MPKKYYAVRVGRKPGVYREWMQCKAQVDKFPSAVFKSFKTMEEAYGFAKIPVPISLPVKNAPIIQTALEKKKSKKIENQKQNQECHERNEAKIKASGLIFIEKAYGKLRHCGKAKYRCLACNNVMFIKRKQLAKNPICRNCMTGQSFGEEKCIQILTQHQIKYQKEKTFSGLKGIEKGSLRFDFLIEGEHRDFLLEIDGEQHRADTIWGGNTKEHDALKKAFCEKKNIPLYRVKYNFGKLIELENAILKVLVVELPKLIKEYQLSNKYLLGPTDNPKINE